MTNEIQDVFATFHDGEIIGWEGNLEKLTLKIDCQYLAKEFKDDFENFYLTIINIKHIELEPWANPIKLEKKSITELKDIFEADLEIGYTEVKNNIVIISCNQHDTKFDYCGGNLYLKAESIEIRNHLKQNYHQMIYIRQVRIIGIDLI